MKIYLAGAIAGRTFEEVFTDWESKVARFREMGYEVYYPLIAKNELKNSLDKIASSKYLGPITNDHAIFTRDQWMVRQADVVYANLCYTERVSIGTMFEIAWASILGKLAVVAIDKDSFHDHAFVREAASSLFFNPYEAEGYLRKLIKGEA